MRIDAVSLSVPSLRVTNENILSWIEEQSRGIPSLRVKTYQRLVQALFRKAGSNIRYILDKKRETAFEHIRRAMTDALGKAGTTPEEIDLLIYCGVGKGFKEPANAYFYAKALKMSCGCFDVCDACMSWVRSAEIAHSFLASGRYRKVMVVNGEFNAHDHGFPELFRAESLSRLPYTFPTYTIGEAASATVFSASETPWSFDYTSDPSLCDLCTITLEGYQGFVEKSEKHNLNGVFKFVSFGKELFENAEKYLTSLIPAHVRDLHAPSLFIPHAASSRAYIEAAKRVGIPALKLFTDVFPLYGNLVSASIPMALHLANDRKALKRGDKVVLIPASAGMSHAVVQFEY
jgi:acyl-CoA:acyl-CoA alkyltransferase